MTLDARKPLPLLQQEWEGCLRCQLGERRVINSGRMVFGEGPAPGRIAFVGEGPGWKEEEEGRPFVGPSGQFLKQVLDRFGMPEGSYYLTNVVACRSCVPRLDAAGLPMMHRGKPQFNDEAPIQAYMDACADRLYEELYMADPVVIVALGKVAATFLLKKTISVAEHAADPIHSEITIPGVTENPVFTEKKGAWVRYQKGVMSLPTEQNMVRYLMVATIHPSYVLSNIENKDEKSELSRFVRDIRFAIEIARRHHQEVYGTDLALAGDLPSAEEVMHAQRATSEGT